MIRGLIVFESVHQALHAEKSLKGAGIGFDLIPTPREISASCGQSISVTPDNIERAIQIMSREMIVYRGVFSADFQHRIFELLHS